MLRRLVLICAVLAIIAGACSGSADDDLASSPPSTPASSAPLTTTSGSSGFAAEFDLGLVEELVALEAANNGEWTVDDAVKALELLLPALEAGVEAYPPIDLRRLMWSLSLNAAEITDEQRATISAAPAFEPDAALVSYRATDEAEREAYQQIVDQASSEFTRLTGHAHPGEIAVVLSEFGLLEGGFSAVAFSAFKADLDLYRAFFASDASFETLVRLFEDATTGGDVACIIIMGEVFRARTVRQQTAAIMHEVTHCHQQAIHPDGPHGFMRDPVLWMDEGYASWAGEEFAGGTVISRNFWNGYHDGVGPIGGHTTTAASYQDIALFSYLHDNGVDSWANFVRYFGDIRGPGSDSARVAEILGSLPDDALATWAASSLRRPDLSAAWDYASGPGIGNSTVSRLPRETPVVADRERSFSTPPGEQGTFALEPVLGGAEALLFEFEMAGPGIVRWPWGEDQLSTSGIKATWCFGPECVCDDGTELGPIAPDFTESNSILVATTGGSFTAVLVEPEEKCEEEEEPLPTADGLCPAGVWAAEPEAVADLLVTLYRDLGIADPTHEGGGINMSFFDDGTFRFDYRETTFTEVIDGIDARFVLTGGSFGTWESDGSLLTVAIEGQDIVLNLILDGGPALTVESPSSTGGGSTDYVCASNNELLIDPSFSMPFWPYPREWIRVSS